MGLGWDLAAQRQLAGDLVKPAILLRIATNPVIRLWSGVGDLAIGADLIESVDGAVYSGLGELITPPTVNALVNGLAERVEFAISGAAVTGEVAAMASTEADAVAGVAVNLGFFVFGIDLQQLSPTAWLWDGVADSLTVNRQPGDDGGAVRTLALSVGSLLTGRQRPSIAFWSPHDQRRRSANDAFCDYVPRYSQGTTKPWPI